MSFLAFVPFDAISRADAALVLRAVMYFCIAFVAYEIRETAVYLKPGFYAFKSNQAAVLNISD